MIPNRSSRNSIFGTVITLAIGVAIFLFAVIIVTFVMIIVNYTNDGDQDSKIHGFVDKLEAKCEEFERQIESILESIENLEIDQEQIVCVEGLCESYPNNLKSLNLLGCWDASTNTPLVLSGIGTDNDAYVVCTNGTTNIDGNNDWSRGDLLIYQSSQNAWIKNDGTCDNIEETWNFLGCWNAAVNTPTITSGVGDDGDAYIVCDAGNTVVDGEDDWERGDLIIYVGGTENVWIKNDGSPLGHGGSGGVNFTADQCINPNATGTSESWISDRYGGNQPNNLYRTVQVSASINGQDLYKQGLVLQQEVVTITEPYDINVPGSLEFSSGFPTFGPGLFLQPNSASPMVITRIGDLIYVDASFGVYQNLGSTDQPFDQALLMTWNLPGVFWLDPDNIRVKSVNAQVRGYKVHPGGTSTTLSKDGRICMLGIGGFQNDETIIDPAPNILFTVPNFQWKVNYYAGPVNFDGENPQPSYCAVTAKVVIQLDNFLDADDFCKTGTPPSGTMFASLP